MTVRYWWEPYRNAPSNTLEGKLWLAAASIVCTVDTLAEHEARCRKVAAVAFENECCIWHACWLANECAGHCSCAPCCQQERKAER